MTVCPSCGAAVRDGESRCPLCGTDLAVPPSDAPANVTETPALDRQPYLADLSEVPVCLRCGHENPTGARYCNVCGEALRPAGAAARPPAAASDPDSAAAGAPATDPAAAGRRALLFVGAGIAVVVALFAVSALSNRTPPEAATGPDAPVAAGDAAANGAAVPDGPTPPLPDSLQRAAAALEAQNSASGWYEAGRYYLTAGFDAQQTGDAQGVLWIRRAIADFEKSLALDDVPDVRFALAEASQFDPADPMRPVVELRTLLAEAPDHVGGNFLLGERRMIIGRLDSARVSFQRVVELAPPGDPLRERAQQMIAQLDQAGAPTRGVPDGSGAAPPAGVPAVPQ